MGESLPLIVVFTNCKSKMKHFLISLITLLSVGNVFGQIADNQSYLNEIKVELLKEWPENRAINLVFHGHSVPSGYFATPIVNTEAAYPLQTLLALKKIYKTAVVNSIVTAIGGENAVLGEMRFEKDVLSLKPDVVFIDYALNDRWVDFDKVRQAWQSMIEKALKQGCKVVLLTPTPDTTEDVLNDGSKLKQHSDMIAELAKKYNVGLVDSYGAFKTIAKNGGKIALYMSQNNHPNEAGHQVVVKEIVKYF